MWDGGSTAGAEPVRQGRGPDRQGHARHTPRHEIEDLNVTSQLRGDFSATHLTGDNALVVATDTQKNTVYGLAREHGIGSPEDFLLLLGRHFTGSFDWVTGGRWAAEPYTWDADRTAHDHAFVRNGQETRTAVLTIRTATRPDRLRASPTWWC